MKKHIFYTAVAVFTISLASAQLTQIKNKSGAEKVLKNWAIENSIATRYIYSGGQPESSIFPSPDGQYFYLVSVSGDMVLDRNIYKIEIFITKDVLAALNNKRGSNPLYLKPIRTATVPSIFFNVYTPKGGKFGWTDDSKSILFIVADALLGLGNNPNDISKLCKLNVSDGSLEIIRSLGMESGLIQKVNNYSKDASTIIFETEDVVGVENNQYSYPASVVISNSIPNILYPSQYRTKKADYLYHNGKISKLQEINNTWLSTDGSRLIISQRRMDFPAAWSTFYKTSKKSIDWWEEKNKDNKMISEFNRFMLIDTDYPENSHSLIEAPTGEHTAIGSKFKRLTAVLFTSDNNYAILVNSALPIKENQAKPDEMAYIVAVNMENGKYEMLAPLISEKDTVNVVRWNNVENELLISYKSGKETKVIGYKRNGLNWIKDTSPEIETPKKSQLPENLNIVVQQNINTAPMVVASNGKNEVYLTEPDTAIQNVYIASTKPISWLMPDGRTLSGGLTLPKGYNKMNPLPLIVENYGFDETKFNPDGGGGYLLQSFATHGYAVLKLDLSIFDINKRYGNNSSHLNEEGPYYLEMVDAAVKMLVDSGLVDPNKIGMLGFSRGGYETLYAITHPGKTKIAAAISIDGWTGSIYNYLIDPPYPDNTPSDYERLYQGSFWKNKKGWLEHEPVFNIDKVRTPVMEILHGYNFNNPSMIIIQTSDLIGAFQLNKKILEVLYYPKSLHSPSRPKEIYSSIVNIIDWMNFWIKGVEDTDPAKAEKYDRWHEFRKMHDVKQM